MVLYQALVELADDHLVLGHRLSEWCGHAPMLEEDLALSNFALDVIGTARSLYAYAAEVEGKGRSEDDLAYLRSEREYLNCLLVERPNGDFAHTMLRQFYFAAFMEPFWQAALLSDDKVIAGIAGKAVKEMAYHIRHSAEWIVRLGDGTEESGVRMRAAIYDLHPYWEEMFEPSECDVLPDRAALRPVWDASVQAVFAEAKLDWPAPVYGQVGGRIGEHSEVLGRMLSDMQYLQRVHPGATW
ncbi:MAG: phenylacetate-CoA oxygenase subunit PaaC [Marinosulfonomonas sp.]|nr:phenylacetate-CoA oxygenase subunit PaaC [Marinosulfonomonas sp.]